MEPATLAVMVVFGLAAHFLAKLIELRRTDPTLTAKRYWQARPYQVAYSVVSAAAAGFVLFRLGELTLLGALAVGYMSDSVMDKLTRRTDAALR